MSSPAAAEREKCDKPWKRTFRIVSQTPATLFGLLSSSREDWALFREAEAAPGWEAAAQAEELLHTRRSRRERV